MSANITALLEQVSEAVSHLRQVLEQQQLTQLESVLSSTQVALQKLNTHPGGISGLRTDIDGLPEETQSRCLAMLQQAKLDYEVNAELIRLAMQRNAALQAYAAQTSSAATYSSEGGVSLVSTGQLLGKF